MLNIIFVGSNPSVASSIPVPFWRNVKSTKVLHSWLNQLGNVDDNLHFFNVSDQPTENNRPLKLSEIRANLNTLNDKLNVFRFHGIEIKVVALGKTAEKALTLLRVPHYAMPHPSGLNRLLNDPLYVQEKINGLKNYIISPSKIES